MLALIPIYHISHIDNLVSIIKRGVLLCDNQRNAKGVACRGIAHQHIKERRARRLVPLIPGGTLADYVPFYFAPRSPMLYSIHRGFVENYPDGQEPVVHLVSSAESVRDAGLQFVFTEGHADISFSEFFDDLADLDEVDWSIMKEKYWNDTADDGDRKRRRQAEFLVHDSVPWPQIHSIGVINEEMAERVRTAIAGANHRPDVHSHRSWYY